MQIAQEIHVSKKAFHAAVKDVTKTAEAVNLIYVNNSQQGITRKRKGQSFHYFDGQQRISDPGLLDRIKQLVIPPAWESVWICKQENGHLQVTGTDKLGRRQYRYHPSWNAIRNQTKFFRLLEFGRQLPRMRQLLQQKLALRGLPKEKVLATVVSLLEHTHIRIGNAFYEKLYGSFGLTTMKNKHVAVSGAKITFSFKGKKGVQHKVGLNNKKLAAIVRNCREIPGKELFEYLDEDGLVHNIDSGMVNEFIREISGGDFSAKDFRTWAGSVEALSAFREMGGFSTAAEMKQKIPAAFDRVAKQLGNTRSVCRKYYVHPVIIALYETNKLDPYFRNTTQQNTPEGLWEEEHTLLDILAGQ